MTERKEMVGGQIGAIPLKDDPGKFQMVALSELNVDHAYQRKEVVENKLKRMAANWSWRRCGCLLAASRNGKLYVFDGQQRLLAARLNPMVSELPVLTFREPGVGAEALAFVGVNTDRSFVKTLDRHKAMLVGKDSRALQVEALVTSTGYRLVTSAANFGVTCVEVFYRQLNPTAFRPGDLVIDRVWPALCRAANGDFIKKNVMEAACYWERFLQRLEAPLTLCTRTIEAELGRIGMDRISQRIQETVGFYGRTTTRLCAVGMALAYNKNKKTKKLPSPDAS